jgi:hypothetical protein
MNRRVALGATATAVLLASYPVAKLATADAIESRLAPGYLCPENALKPACRLKRRGATLAILGPDPTVVSPAATSDRVTLSAEHVGSLASS